MNFDITLPNAESPCCGSNKHSIVSTIPSLKESQATKWSQLPWDNIACHLGSTYTFCFLFLSRVSSLGSLPRRKSGGCLLLFPCRPLRLIKNWKQIPIPRRCRVGFSELCISSMSFQHLGDGISELREASFPWVMWTQRAALPKWQIPVGLLYIEAIAGWIVTDV